MKVYVESVLDCPPERVWDEVQTCALLREVIRPLAWVEPADPGGLPKRWSQGSTVRCRMYLFGFIPLGVHTIVFERVDPVAREIQSHEYDRLIQRWDHLVRVREAADGKALYSDEIEINAGFLTVPVWLFAQGFYRHRQRRWRGVARRLAAQNSGR